MKKITVLLVLLSGCFLTWSQEYKKPLTQASVIAQFTENDDVLFYYSRDYMRGDSDTPVFPPEPECIYSIDDDTIVFIDIAYECTGIYVLDILTGELKKKVFNTRLSHYAVSDCSDRLIVSFVNGLFGCSSSFIEIKKECPLDAVFYRIQETDSFYTAYWNGEKMLLLEADGSPYDFCSQASFNEQYDITSLTEKEIISAENAEQFNSSLYFEDFINSIIRTNFPLEKEYLLRRYKTKDGIIYSFENDIKYSDRYALDMQNSSFKVYIKNPYTGQKIEKSVGWPDFNVYSAVGFEFDVFKPYGWNFTASENGDIYYLDFALDSETFQKELKENNYKKVPDFRVNLKCLKNNWKEELALSPVPQENLEAQISESSFKDLRTFFKGKSETGRAGEK
ncbi:MAG: hypothetical protein J6Z17_01240 [Treponema sp.]|nr:hypothetical protein [Treponema sp.]